MSRSDSSHQGAAERLSWLLPPAAADALLADAEATTPIDGPDGLLAQITKVVCWNGLLDVEIADHLGYEAGDTAGTGPVIPATGMENAATVEVALSDDGFETLSAIGDQNA